VQSANRVDNCLQAVANSLLMPHILGGCGPDRWPPGMGGVAATDPVATTSLGGSRGHAHRDQPARRADSSRPKGAISEAADVGVPHLANWAQCSACPRALSTRARTAGSVLPHLRRSTTRALHLCQCRVLRFERTNLPSPCQVAGHIIGCPNVLQAPFAARNPVLRALVCAPTQCEFGAMIGRFLRFLEPAQEQALLAAAPIKTLKPGEVVVEEGISQRAIFVVEEGAVRIERGKADAVIAVLGPGQFFGEMSFIDGGPTS